MAISRRAGGLSTAKVEAAAGFIDAFLVSG